jgi:hypothetical protein
MSTTGGIRPRAAGERAPGPAAAPRPGPSHGDAKHGDAKHGDPKHGDPKHGGSAHGRPRGGHAGSRQAPAPVRLTGRGCVLLMLVTFGIGDLIAAWTHVDWLGGLGYAAGFGLAVAYARREALLMVAAAPPALFLGALVVVQLMTAGRSTGLSVAEGTFLTLAATAPWLLGGTAACLAAATMRGLPRCVQELRVALAGQSGEARLWPRRG